MYSLEQRKHHTQELIDLTSRQVFYYYSYGTAAWLAIQALPLLVSPTMIVTMISPEVRKPTSQSTQNPLFKPFT